jgi:hypothetical protein
MDVHVRIWPVMRIIRGVKNCCEKFSHPVLTLGNFDGVHLGHQAIFRKVVERAKEAKGTAIAFTFEPHPLKVLAPDRSPRLLNTFHGKMKLMECAGIQVVVCADFDREFAEQNPEEFARRVLVEGLDVREVYVGYDYAFGKGREGSIASLKAMGEQYGFVVGVVDAVQVNGTAVSSSRVRDVVTEGRVEEAPKYLGRVYAIEGHVRPHPGVPDSEHPDRQRTAAGVRRLCCPRPLGRQDRRRRGVDRGAADLRRRTGLHRGVPLRLRRRPLREACRGRVHQAAAGRAQVP